MAGKRPKAGPAPALDLLQQLRERIDLASRNDGTLEAMDGGLLTPMKLAVALCLWGPSSKWLVRAQIGDGDDPNALGVVARNGGLGLELFNAMRTVRRERQIAEMTARFLELAEVAEDDDFPRDDWRKYPSGFNAPVFQIALCAILKIDNPPRPRAPSDTEQAAISNAVERYWAFVKIDGHSVSPALQRQIKNVLFYQDTMVAAVVEEANGKVPQKTAKAGKALRAAATALGNVPTGVARNVSVGLMRFNLEPSTTLFGNTTFADHEWNLDGLIALLSQVADDIEDHARRSAAGSGWLAVKLHGNQDNSRADAIHRLEPIFFAVTGMKANAHWSPIEENRKRPFYRFVAEIITKAGHQDWLTGLEDAIRKATNPRRPRAKKVTNPRRPRAKK